MMINIGILGYGNLGRGIECAVKNNPDMCLTGIFTRRDPKDVKTLSNVPVYSSDDLVKHSGEVDVLILCGGSATDLPLQTPEAVRYFNVVDSFDTHANIPKHFAAVDKAAKETGHIGFISVGWDPGLFSLARLYSNIALPDGRDYTFWGRGVSQGHSDAIRRIEGVKDARQYTVPVPEAMERVRRGENPELTTREKHLRECYVVAEEGADPDLIANRIKTMPNYFADYNTTVKFISEEELRQNHAGLPHGGCVIRSGRTGWNHEFANTMEFSLKLESNPAFTASVITAFARAAYKMSRAGMKGCKTVFDVPPIMLSPDEPEDIIAHLL